MNDIFRKIERIGIVPVVVIEEAKQAYPLGKALCDGGLPCAEITFRTSEAPQAIHLMRKEYPKMLIGAGTVLTREQVDLAIEAGAGFIVSPGLNPNVVKYCQERNVPVIPGIVTPGELEHALSLGLKTVKFFPAELSGGVKMLKTLASVYGDVKFLPTGGISAENVLEYLKVDQVFACGGSWMVKKQLVEEGKFDTIMKLCRQASELVKERRE